MTPDHPSRADDAWQQRWSWDRGFPPRRLLVGHTGTPQYPGEDAVALCADITGLFGEPARPLTDPDLWGRRIDDERYAVVATL